MYIPVFKAFEIEVFMFRQWCPKNGAQMSSSHGSIMIGWLYTFAFVPRVEAVFYDGDGNELNKMEVSDFDLIYENENMSSFLFKKVFFLFKNYCWFQSGVILLYVFKVKLALDFPPHPVFFLQFFGHVMYCILA